MTRSTLLIALLLSFVLGRGPLEAQERGSQTAAGHEKRPDPKAHSAAGAHSGNHEAHPHHVAAFLGGTSNLHEEHTDFTVGCEYEYRAAAWKRRVGVGVLTEFVLAHERESIVAGMLVVHPVGGLKAIVAPGVIIAREGGAAVSHALAARPALVAAESPAIEAAPSTRRFLFRVGAGYDFHFRRFSVTPTLSVDTVDRHVSLVYGLAFGIGF